MTTNNQQAKEQDNLTLGLSLFIALCIIVLFCAISFAITKNVDSISKEQSANSVPLPSVSVEEDSTSSLEQ